MTPCCLDYLPDNVEAEAGEDHQRAADKKRGAAEGPQRDLRTAAPIEVSARLRASAEPKGGRLAYIQSRLDHVWVLFIVPDDASHVMSNLEVVTAANRDSWCLPIPRAAAEELIVTKITEEVRGFLKGSGRPKVRA